MDNSKAFRRIDVLELELGMVFCGFDMQGRGSAISTGARLISSPEDLARIRSSGAAFCWIDPTSELGQRHAEAAPDATLRLREQARRVAQQVFHQLRLGKAIDVPQCLELVEAIAAATSQSASALMSLIRIKKADEYTFMHSIAVSGLMMSLARTMGMESHAVKLAGFAGFLHDIGKAFIPLEVLNKEGRLSAEEFAIIARHAVLGYESLRDDPRIPDEVKDVCLHHHEKMDGSGYPHQLSAPDISIYARMAAICDVYDALTSVRPYKSGWDPAVAIAAMASWQGRFDPSIFQAFVRTLGIYPEGSIVKLRSGRSAVVVAQNQADLTRPVVKVFAAASGLSDVDAQAVDLLNSEDHIVQKGAESYLELHSAGAWRQG